MKERKELDKLAVIANQKTKEKEHWLNALSGNPRKSSFPADYKTGGGKESNRETVTFRLTGDTFQRLMNLRNNFDPRLHIIFTAGVAALFYRYTNDPDVLIGTCIYKQEEEAAFINTLLPLRILIENNSSFKKLLLLVRDILTEAVENYRYPMEVLAQQLNIDSKGEEFPFFDVVVLLENIQPREYIRHIPYNMAFSFLRTDNTIEGAVEYNGSLYDEATIRRIIHSYCYMLEKAIFNVELPLYQVPVLPPGEKQRLLFEFNNTAAGFPKDRTIPQLFVDQVEETPDRIALVGSEGQEQLTYRHLDQKANRLAWILKRKGIKPGHMVGLILHRSTDMITAILAILKTGAGYLPLTPGTPRSRIEIILEDSDLSLLLTTTDIASEFSFTTFQGLRKIHIIPQVTAVRPQILDMDQLPFPDRSLVDYEKYNQYIGLAAVKDCMTLQTTRGCPYKCAYCHKIWPKSHVARSAENIFAEVSYLYEMGVRRFSLIDDIFNLNIKNSRRFFELIIRNRLDIQLYFPNGVRGDILTKDYIDLMIKAGAVNIALALETASPRLQKLIKKNLNIDKFKENVQYIIETYPHVIIELFTMHGFPTETEEEAMMTLDFIKSLKWLHFPYVFILKVYPHTEMETLAIANGVSSEMIALSADGGFHELPETLPFDKKFTQQYQSEFLNQYFLSRERLLHVLPYQMKVLTVDEIVQKYNAYLAEEINSFNDLLNLVGITREELGNAGFPEDNYMVAPRLNQQLKNHFPTHVPDDDAFKVLILDLSTFFSHQVDVFYDMLEPPLGPMYLLTYLNMQLGPRVHGKIAKSRIDFDNYEQLHALLEDFHPQVIGIRTLTYFKDFFHQVVSTIRQWGIDVPIIAGGPYATSDYSTLLQDHNIDLVVIGEGEVTFHRLITKMMDNKGRLPQEKELQEIAGIAYRPQRVAHVKKMEPPVRAREILMIDQLTGLLSAEPKHNLDYNGHASSDFVYNIFTSGSTGLPKGTLTNHTNVIRVVKNTNYIDLGPGDRLLQLSNYSFDGSIFDIFGALLNGASLVLLSEKELMEVDLLTQVIRRQGITVFFVTTALFNTLVELDMEGLSKVRKILFGGERVSLEHTRKALEYLGCGRLVHMYGPTETTVYATSYNINRIDDRRGTIPIGRPLSNTTAYILNERLEPVPTGLEGELYIGGQGLSAGYQNRVELTADRFIPHPFVQGERLYRTGDLVRLLSDGEIEFLDRKDKQVKLRGFRVELGEIESRLLSHPNVREAVVAALENIPGERRLCAYLVLSRECGTLELRDFLSRYLPAFMIPAYFAVIDKMPLNANGKLDIQRLPVPQTETDSQHIAPRSDKEKKIADIWKEVLHIDKIGIHDNYFEQGGNSLNIIQLHNKLKTAFNRDISLAKMFRYPTIDSFCNYLIETEMAAITPGLETPLPHEEEKGVAEMSRIETGINREIAVIGMSGRFPGARNIDEFWENLKQGVESITFLSAAELEASGVSPEAIQDPGFVKTMGGVLKDLEYFDATFFNYTPDEAEIMAPQMRIFHECVWEALENAGYNPYNYDGLIGIYAGVSPSFHWETLTAVTADSADSNHLANLMLSSRDFLCTRLSYVFNLKGPATIIETACSTSLVAIDQARRSLLDGQCHMALAGGVQVTFPPLQGYRYQEGMINSPDGHCRSFDARSGGTVGGDGAGVVLLKPLQQALADGDFIHAVIKGSAVNNDGNRKVGFTAPGVEGQAAVIRAALRSAAVESESITYIEAHGTATPLGDTVEIEALTLAFNTKKTQFCGIGSVKSNVGHLNRAAGVAGFIKTVLALKYHQIPPSINFETPNPAIHFADSPFFVVSHLRPWKNEHYPLRAGVSSFGIGGTNAHVILEEAQAPTQKTCPGMANSTHRFQLLVFSARTGAALETVTENFRQYLRQNPAASLEDAAYTLQVGRRAFKHRRMLVSRSLTGVLDILSAPDNRNLHTSASGSERPRVIYMFPGLGAQYADMGRQLYEEEPRFKEEMERCFKILAAVTDFDIKGMLYPSAGNSAVDRTVPGAAKYQDLKNSNGENLGDNFEIAQLVTFIFEYSLAKLLLGWGIFPSAMIGYSFGEYTAACLAGVFSLEDALSLVALRGKLVSRTNKGAMLSVPMPKESLTPLLTSLPTPIGAELSIAIDNGPSCVVSGSVEAVDKFEIELKKMKYLCTRLPASYAIHSPLMAPVINDFDTRLKQVKLNKPCIPYLSNVSGTWITGEEALDRSYWLKHLRQTVHFASAIKELVQGPGSVFIEIGPGRDLSVLVRHHVPAHSPHNVVNLIPSENDRRSDTFYLLNKVGWLWLYGINIDWHRFNQGESRKRTPLPTYPFEKKRSWKKVDQYLQGKIPQSAPVIDPGKKKNIDDWFYLPTWSRSLFPNSIDKPGKTGAEQLIFADETGLADRLSARLSAERCFVAIVRKGIAFKKEDRTHYSLEPGNAEHLRRLVDSLTGDGFIPGRIIHLWSLGAEENDIAGTDLLQTVLRSGFYTLAYLARAISGHPTIKESRIMVVGSHIQEVTGAEPIIPEKATLLGPCKVIPQEYPHIKCRIVDIELPGRGEFWSDSLAMHLLEEFNGEPGDSVVAYRGKHRWVQRFQPVKLPAPKSMIPPLKQGGVYLITGGLGRIGLQMAKFLAREVNARLILSGRTPLPPPGDWDTFLMQQGTQHPVSRKILAIRDIEAADTQVMAVRADVASQQDMERLIATAEERFGPLNGVIYSAAAPLGKSFQTIGRITEEQCRQHFEAKIYGIQVLLKVLKGKTPDFCLLMSSTSAILGGLGFTAYAAANAFMDAFAQQQGTSLHCLSVNWEGWYTGNTEGNGSNHDSKRFLNHMRMTSDEGIEAFKRVLCHNGGFHLVHSPVDLQVRIQQWINLDPESTTTGNETKTGSERPRLMNPYIAPRTPLEKDIARLWQRLLGLEEVGISDDFLELGGDSLKAINAVSRIHKQYNVEVPLEAFFKEPTVSALARFIDASDTSICPMVESVEVMEYYALSSAQKRLYILQQMEPESTGYNIFQPVELVGILDLEKIEGIFLQLLAKHESLRTSFIMVDGKPFQKIFATVDFHIHFFSKGVSRDITLEQIFRDFIKPFDLHQAPLFRVGLVPLEEARRLLIVDMHHIITDAVTIMMLLHEFITLYNGFSIPGPGLQYKDYAAWQNREKELGVIKKQERFWLDIYADADALPRLNLPYDYPRPLLQNFAGERYKFQVDPEVTGALKKIGLQHRASLYMNLLALFNTLLYKYTSQDDIIIGCDTAGRSHADLEHIAGMFVNMLPMRNHPQGAKTYLEFLEEVKDNSIKAFENQDFQFDDLVDRLELERDPSRNPIFDVEFVLQNTEYKAEPLQTPSNRLAGEKKDILSIVPYEYDTQTARFDLGLDVFDRGDEIHFSLEYCTKLFKGNTIRQLARHFKNIMTAVVMAPKTALARLEMISPEEKRRMLLELNDTRGEVVRDQGYHRIFEQQAARTPHQIAVVCEDRRLSYSALYGSVRRTARFIAPITAGNNALVALHMDRGIEMLVTILAAFQAGCAYIPIPPDYPEARVKFILEESRPALVFTCGPRLTPLEGLLTNSTFKGAIGCMDSYPWMPAIDIDNDIPDFEFPIQPGYSPDHLAYLIYTSGTTGNPKGVMIHQLGMLNHLYAKINDLSLNETDTIAQTASAGFDISVWQYLAALLVGGKTVVVKKDIVLDSRRFLTTLRQQQITVLELVPSLLNAFLHISSQDGDTELRHLRWMIPTGEPLALSLAEEWYRHYPQIRLLNAYGPTEASDDVTHYVVKNPPIYRDSGIPIGKPLQNLHIYILDRDMNLCPPGVRGEICVAGLGVGKGYWQDRKKTDSVFIPNPFREEIGEDLYNDYAVLYRTGDVGYIMEDGNIQCLGRLDHQVKIRGNRIELKEIENQLLKLPEINEAVVLVKEDQKSGKLLCAYMVTGKNPDISRIRDGMGSQVPAYMIPAHFFVLDKMPLTANGKTDRKALLALDIPNETNNGVEDAPENWLQEILLKIWQEVLGTRKIGIRDNFFQSGGDSIDAMQVAAKLQGVGYKLEIRDLFLKPTIQQLSQVIKKDDRVIQRGPVTGVVPLSPIQMDFFNRQFTDNHHFNQAVMLYRAEGFARDPVQRAFAKIVEHHDALRMVFKIDQEGNVIQENRGAEGTHFHMEEFHLEGADDFAAQVLQESTRIQRSINLAQGPMLKLALFHCPGTGSHLLVVIHHLVIDSVSWRILLEDFAIGYARTLRGESVVFQEKTDSFKYWARQLSCYAGSNKALRELKYWNTLEVSGLLPLPSDLKASPGTDKVKYNDSVYMTLSVEETAKLLKEANQAYNTEVNDLLLTALALAVKEWAGAGKVAVTLEGHGRESILDGVEISRTVGWFTSEFPVILNVSSSDDISHNIKYIKESLRRIPNKGVGYGILKYLSPPDRDKGRVFELQPGIIFNYMGQFAAEDNKGEIFSMSPLPTGDTVGPELERSHLIDINGMVVDGKLGFMFVYSSLRFTRETMVRFLESYRENLQKIIAHCTRKKEKELTASDMGSGKLSMDDFQKINRFINKNIKIATN